MTLVNTETGVVLDVETAERRASFICTDLDHAADTFETAMERMREAIRERDDLVLGYRSPGDYLSDRFGGRLARLGVDLRREVVRELTEAGLSKRAIAPVVGVSHVMVGKDRAALSGGNPVTTSTAPASAALGEEADAGQTPEGESTAAPTAERDVTGASATPAPRPPVTGIDGKTYAPRPAQPRTPLRSVDEAEWSAHDRAEDLARNLARNLSLLYALTNPERRAEYIATWHEGTRELRPLGSDFITPTHMRDLAEALDAFASEWESANV